MKNLSAPLFVVAFLAAQGSVTVTFAAGALPENIPDFSQDTSRPAVQSVRSGSWSSPSTWGGAVPTANHVVRIVLGHIVTIDDTSAVAYTIAVDGKLAFAPTVNTRLKVTNLEVMAGDMGMGAPGVLEVGTPTAPVADNMTAEIVIAPMSGFGPEPHLTIQNSYLRNWTNVNVPTNGSVNGCWMDNKLVVVTNTRFDAPPGRSLSSIAMTRDVASAPECLTKLDEARVYTYNGNASDNFQVYHSSPAVLPRPPAGCSSATRPGVTGLTCPIAPLTGPPAPSAPQNLRFVP